MSQQSEFDSTGAFFLSISGASLNMSLMLTNFPENRLCWAAWDEASLICTELAKKWSILTFYKNFSVQQLVDVNLRVKMSSHFYIATVFLSTRCKNWCSRITSVIRLMMLGRKERGRNHFLANLRLRWGNWDGGNRRREINETGNRLEISLEHSRLNSFWWSDFFATSNIRPCVRELWGGKASILILMTWQWWWLKR